MFFIEYHVIWFQEEQLDAILCTAVETSSLGLITGCIKQWTTEGEDGRSNALIVLIYKTLFHH